MVKSVGDIEPCKVEIKASAPIKKFLAMTELMAAMDMLVEGLKPCVAKLNHIYERSDAMLAGMSIVCMYFCVLVLVLVSVLLIICVDVSG